MRKQKNNMKPTIAIIYLCYGNLRHLPDVVKSWENLKYPHDRIKIFMVPNNSPDGIQDVIRAEVLPRSEVDLPKIELIDDGENRGFAGGNNVATRIALEAGFDYIYLQNGDLTLGADAIDEIVDIAESDSQIGSVQSLVMYWHERDVINVSGGMFHVAGYGFARDNLLKISDKTFNTKEEISYCSGASVLYRASALKKVGLLEEGFFMYHEDLELGLRLRIAGYKNMLASKSLVYHDYSFSRNPKKFAWTELYRWVVVLAYYKLPTLIVLAPLLLIIELGTWPMSVMGGWFKAKLWAYAEMVKPRTWNLIFSIRRRAKRLRVISDREQLRFVNGVIEAQETSNWIVEYIANPSIKIIWKFLKKIIVW